MKKLIALFSAILLVCPLANSADNDNRVHVSIDYKHSFGLSERCMGVRTTNKDGDMSFSSDATCSVRTEPSVYEYLIISQKILLLHNN